MAWLRKHWIVCGVVGWIAACGQGSDVSPDGCIAGNESACACTDGTTGAQVCLSDGTFSPCECGGQSSAPGCTPGNVVACTCQDGRSGTQTCRSDAVYDQCACTATGSGGLPGTGGTVGSGGFPGTGGTTPPGGTGGGGGSVDGSGGTPDGSGGAATGGSGGAATGGSGGATTVNEPIIPSPDGSCPTFTTGSQTIKGLSTNILAGTPGATKGPLLFTWHGTGSSGNAALNFQLPSSVRNEITSQGGIVIAPNDNGAARTGSSPNGVWYETSDLDYADHIVACAVQNHNIDPRRIYTTGCSAGGLMAGAMAVKRSRYIAAAAPNSGGLVGTFNLSLQDPARVPAVMTMHGGSGDNVGINFGTTSATLYNFIKPRGGFAVDCNHASGHCGAPSSLHERAWEFMKAHPFGTSPSPYAGGLPGNFPMYCEIK